MKGNLFTSIFYFINHFLVKKFLQFKKKYVRVFFESGNGAIFWASKPNDKSGRMHATLNKYAD